MKEAFIICVKKQIWQQKLYLCYMMKKAQVYRVWRSPQRHLFTAHRPNET